VVCVVFGLLRHSCGQGFLTLAAVASVWLVFNRASQIQYLRMQFSFKKVLFVRLLTLSSYSGVLLLPSCRTNDIFYYCSIGPSIVYADKVKIRMPTAYNTLFSVHVEVASLGENWRPWEAADMERGGSKQPS
jgi:hypothetical protein